MPRGPVPKREEDRIRRNKPDIPVEKLEITGDVAVPALDIPGAHEIVIDWYESLAASGQARFYEPSDWQTARLAAYVMNLFLKSKKPSAQMLQTLQSLLSDLMVTEGSRRRLRLEIERNKPATSPEDDETAKVIALYSQMFEAS